MSNPDNFVTPLYLNAQAALEGDEEIVEGIPVPLSWIEDLEDALAIEVDREEE